MSPVLAALALHRDVKTFIVGTFPYDHPLMPPDPVAQGIADGRLKLELRTDTLAIDVHHEVAAIGGVASGFTVDAGVGASAPEAVELSWVAADDPGLTVRGRTDRLMATIHLPSVDLTLGRQPISFGSGLVFTPFDLVAPFVPTTIDQEYKPGVDAARVDVFAGTAGRFTAVAAYAGSWDLDGTVLAAHGQVTVGVTDLRVLVAEVHADEVGGLGVTTAIGPVGAHLDATITGPDGGGDPFVRAVAGADGRPTAKSTVAAELYVQTLGAAAPRDYLLEALDPRFVRGELWLLGRYYAAVTGAYELTPLVTPSVALIANLADPSVLVAPSVQWSVGDESLVAVGATIGAGRRPDPVDPADLVGLPPAEALGAYGVRSEFGTYPVSAFLQMKAYF
ncbi:MAG: hypothetical protein ABMB14_13520 [Myxococcota bacterium]